MQFFQHGPDIPDALLQAHEEGRVVFFCGAGISYPAGLAGFRETVDRIYTDLGTHQWPEEKTAYGECKYDAALNLLEGRYPGGWAAVREALVRALQPDYARPNATTTHEALLTLAKTRSGATRLVTTNFDRIFDEAASRLGVNCPSYAAPMLPIPKKSRWNGLVYLHGVLPVPHAEEELRRLVLTSGDFGLAYLHERWASRFVSELFRNYIVCFVGYSIGDPVVRYMMDALAVDGIQGESILPAYAFGHYEEGMESTALAEWKAKGVTPVLYSALPGYDHSLMHRSLKAWADTYRDGVLGRKRIITNHALARPSVSTRQDDFVGRVLWALVYETGEPARVFAEFDPVPSLDWLDAFTDPRFRHQDLGRFGVPALPEVAGDLKFSLAHRPAPYPLAPRMALVDFGAMHTSLDATLYELARWLCRHLNDPKLLGWITRHGGRVHPVWASLIERELRRLADLQDKGQTEELERIQKLAPHGVPGAAMRILWRLLLTGRVSTRDPGHGLSDWTAQFKRDGLTTALKLALRDLLRPRVRIEEQIFPDLGAESGAERARQPQTISRLMHWEVVLTDGNALHWLHDMHRNHARAWRLALPSLLTDAQQLLLDALDLMAELSQGNGPDKSTWHMPSIREHWQNRGFHVWTALIELIRDAWHATHAVNAERARQAAAAWAAIDYPLFQRLALHAASVRGAVEPQDWLRWLLRDNARNLWMSDTLRETSRLLVLQGRSLGEGLQQRLEQAIVDGPSLQLYVHQPNPERWLGLVKRHQWQRLQKLIEGQVRLGPLASRKLAELAPDFADWRPSEHAREEFAHWSSGTGDPDFEVDREIDIAPKKLPDLLVWLQKPPQEDISFFEDSWRKLCDAKPQLALKALSQLAGLEVWPAQRWRTALQVWHEPQHRAVQTRRCLPLLLRMPHACLIECIHSLSYWLEAVAEVDLPRQGADFYALARTLLALPLDAKSRVRDGEGQPLEEPVMDAINHPVGHVTTALLNRWLHGEPSDEQGLPKTLRIVFTQLCDRQLVRFTHARVILASRVIALMRVDSAWTLRHLLPLFDWGADLREARAAWEGFLWSPRLYLPLLLAFKQDLLETAWHYAELGEHQQQFASFIAYAALQNHHEFPAAEFQAAVNAFPPAGLEEVAGALRQAMKSAPADKQVEYFDNYALAFWRAVWPQDIARASRGIASELALLCVAAGQRFDVAVDLVFAWMMPLAYPHHLLTVLAESKLSLQFPDHAMKLLDKVIVDQAFLGDALHACLDQILQGDAILSRDPHFLRLHGLARR